MQACPKCKLIVVLADDLQSDGLMVAIITAASLGATVISNRWDAPESGYDSIASAEAYFNHPGVAIFVASGDNGYDDGGQESAARRSLPPSNSRGCGSSCSTNVAKPAPAFNDVTTGKNGTCTTAHCKAAARWDGPTGIGMPDGAKLAAPCRRPGSGTSTGSGTIGGGSDTTDTDSGSSGGCNAGGGMAGSGSLS